MVFVDLRDEEVYYLPLQDYFHEHPDLYERVMRNSQTVDVHIPVDQKLTEDDTELQILAEKIYTRDFQNQYSKLTALKS